MSLITSSRSSCGETPNTASGVPSRGALTPSRQPKTQARFGEPHDPAHSQLEESVGQPTRRGHRDSPLYKVAISRGQSLLRAHVSLGAASLSRVQVFLH